MEPVWILSLKFNLWNFNFRGETNNASQHWDISRKEKGQTLPKLTAFQPSRNQKQGKVDLVKEYAAGPYKFWSAQNFLCSIFSSEVKFTTSKGLDCQKVVAKLVSNLKTLSFRKIWKGKMLKEIMLTMALRWEAVNLCPLSPLVMH